MEYTALLTQIGTTFTNATVTVLENTLSGTPVWSYVGVGQYELTLVGEWSANKVSWSISTINAVNAEIDLARATTDVLPVNVSVLIAGVYTASNNQLSVTPIEIRVYP